ncbi:hypothetical protein LOD99_8934 [Oopsacas minuta]|uniref:Tc1-like transposase DDE domain-containing protein n=1 Tax=Oopsacas minuta TaxID=111878 RepID=A0AAV7JEA7_9METZ|nr:hypothetical protein LOD99_8934 [Oopsacas minuta]
MVGCSQKSVAEILKKHRLTGTVRDLAIPGRLRVTTKRQDNLLVRKCKKDRFKTATQIKAEVLSEYSIKLSTSTVQRRSHKNWKTEEWARVVFSDESRFLLYTNDGRAYVRRMKGEEFSERCLQKTCKFGGGGIMVCGCFCWSGVGLLWKVSGNLKTNSYIDILENALIPSVDLHSLHSDWTFQQDNAPYHMSKGTKQWFGEQKIEVMNWPAQSPDLNPIENLWDHISLRIQEKSPSNHSELWNAILRLGIASTLTDSIL